jgi:hypothetical protein
MGVIAPDAQLPVLDKARATAAQSSACTESAVVVSTLTTPLSMRGRIGGMRFRKLRIVWSAACGIAVVLLILMWLRSRHTLDFLEWSRSKYGGSIAVTSFDGECEFMFATNNKIWTGMKPGFTYVTRRERFAPWAPSWTGFAVNGTNEGNHFFMAPYWFLASVGSFMTAASWFPWHFTLRTLLIATTLVAVVLELATWETSK